MNRRKRKIVFWLLILDTGVGAPPPDPELEPGTYAPSLDFADGRNSQYATFWN